MLNFGLKKKKKHLYLFLLIFILEDSYNNWLNNIWLKQWF